MWWKVKLNNTKVEERTGGNGTWFLSFVTERIQIGTKNNLLSAWLLKAEPTVSRSRSIKDIMYIGGERNENKY